MCREVKYQILLVFWCFLAVVFASSRLLRAVLPREEAPLF